VIASASYEGYTVVRAHIENEKQIAEINTWEIDVWSRDSTLDIGSNDIQFNLSSIAFF
jgi:hypothetical protein